MTRNSALALVAGCLWLVSALMLLSGVWVGLAYHYSLSEWLSLIPFPAESEEIVPWFLRAVPFAIFIGSTLYIAVYMFRKARLAGR